MKEQTDSVPESRIPAPEWRPAHAGGRAQWQQAVHSALERAARAGMRAAVVAVEVNPDYARRAPELLDKVLHDWRRRRSERFDAEILGPGRFVLTIAPIALPGHARALAERFTRALDPRICPLLARALPYAWSGVSVYPEDGIDPAALIARAEHALQVARAAGSSARTTGLARRRHAATAVLGQVAAHRATVEP